jgi:toxin ParE1/3/4
MPTYSFTDSASQDLAEIIDYTIGYWGTAQADLYLMGFQNLAQTLADNPSLARPCANLQTGLRAFPYQSHMIYFLDIAAGIVIVRILHRRMNPELHLGDRD